MYEYYRLKMSITRQKNFFINTLSHDFKIPAIAQIRALELIQKHYLPEEPVKTLLDEINTSCKYTFEQAAILTDIYKAEKDDTTLNRETFSFLNNSELFSEDLHFSAKQKNIIFINNTNSDFITADKKYFIKALKLILETVINLSDKNTKIKLSTHRKCNRLHFELNYTGIPFSFTDDTVLFSDLPSYSTVGHGIRIYFFKKIINLHKGCLQFKQFSNRKNQIYFAIPQTYNVVKPNGIADFLSIFGKTKLTPDFTNFNIKTP